MTLGVSRSDCARQDFVVDLDSTSSARSTTLHQTPRTKTRRYSNGSIPPGSELLIPHKVQEHPHSVIAPLEVCRGQVEAGRGRVWARSLTCRSKPKPENLFGGVVVSYLEWVQNLQSYSWSNMEVQRKLADVMQNSREQSRMTSYTRASGVVVPSSTEQVSACLSLAHQYRIVWVARGAGSELSGGVVSYARGARRSLGSRPDADVDRDIRRRAAPGRPSEARTASRRRW